jgi:succinyl-diaminopimelate desuccinylase
MVNGLDVVEITKELIRRPSVTPEDGGCLDYIASLLEPAGFRIQRLDCEGVKNLWLTFGSASPLIVFAGHCDVVPPGPIHAWTSPPFEPTEREGKLYGRGAADMKGGLAAMLVAMHDFARSEAATDASLGFLVTSDEEGPGINGTRFVLEQLRSQGIRIDYALVGEPTSENSFGDMAKVGRRGSLSCRMTILGKQGHVAYPHLAANPIHLGLPFLSELVTTVWDEGNKWFAPTSLQISNIHGGNGAGNVIPGEVTIDFNLRYSTESSHEGLQAKIEAMANQHDLDCRFEWNPSSQPFLTQNDTLTDAIRAAVGDGLKLGTGGGTSDARFFAAEGIPVIEFGVSNATIHAVDERVDLEDLQKLVNVFGKLLHSLTKG